MSANNMTETNMNFCKDCKHFIKDESTSVKFGKCAREPSEESQSYYRVTGENDIDDLPYARVERTHGIGRCGVEAKYFESAHA